MSKRDNPRFKGREDEKNKKSKAPRRPGAGPKAAKETGDRKPAAKKQWSGSRETEPRQRAFGHDRDRDREENPNLIIGRNPVMEAIKSGRTIDKILMQRDGEGSIKKIASMARERGLQIQYVEKIALDRLCPGRPHQGLAAMAAVHDYASVAEIMECAAVRQEDPFVILLDGLEDPHNLGAILRSAEGAGAHGVVIPSRRAVGLTETVAKASAGAIEYVPVAKAGNMVRAIEELKELGLWVTGLDMDGIPYSQAELKGPVALVVGGEGGGLSRLIREKCDQIVSIPMSGKISSLNASNAAAVLLFEIRRQRQESKETETHEPIL
ncbi:MAG TPA: 23S rRNA (guanosine(2251)-2'-O)-methyltransferase RlmB [Clostridiales bacterium]|nr:23S rRNA (guanosine(2251)-2'-O)-methyltransferase RlmB [Clostridiales bacterium]